MDIKERIEKSMDLVQKHIVYLLYSDSQSPVKGRSWLQKEIFLISKNIEDLERQSDFEAHLQGPYSEEVDEALEQLSLVGVVKIEGKITLSNMGVEIAKKISKDIPNEIREIIQDMKSFLNDMTEDELLAYVYFSFPEMTKQSVKLDQAKKARESAAIKLFSHGKLSIGKASQIAGMNKEKFIYELRKRKISVYEE